MAINPVNLRILYQAVGRLFIRFGDIETCLSSCLRANLSAKFDALHEARAERFVAAVYGSQRFKASRDTAKRIILEEAILNPAQTAALYAVFEHIAHIANLRDKLAHQHTFLHPEDQNCVLISDGYSTRRLDDAQMWALQGNDINDAAADLLAARKWLSHEETNGPLFGYIPELPPTWRYKPTSLKLLSRETADALLEHATRLSASLE